MSPGAPALLAVFVWLSSPEVLGAVLLAALCHELGHYAALRRRGGPGPAQSLSAVDGGGSAGLRGGAVYKTAEIGLCFP